MSPAEEAKEYAEQHGYIIQPNARRYDVFRTGEAVEIANVGGYPAALNAMKRDVESKQMHCDVVREDGAMGVDADRIIGFEEAAAKTGVPVETLRSVHASESSLHLQLYGRALRIPVSVGFDPAKPGADVSVVTLNDVINANIDTVEKSIGVKPGTLRGGFDPADPRGMWRTKTAAEILDDIRSVIGDHQSLFKSTDIPKLEPIEPFNFRCMPRWQHAYGVVVKRPHAVVNPDFPYGSASPLPAAGWAIIINDSDNGARYHSRAEALTDLRRVFAMSGHAGKWIRKQRCVLEYVK